MIWSPPTPKVGPRLISQLLHHIHTVADLEGYLGFGIWGSPLRRWGDRVARALESWTYNRVYVVDPHQLALGHGCWFALLFPCMLGGLDTPLVSGDDNGIKNTQVPSACC